MEYDLLDTHCADEGVPSTAQEHIPTEQSTPGSVMSSLMYSEMSVSALAAQYQRELEHSRQGEPYSETYAVELFRRATVQSNQEAREAWQRCLSGIVLGWLHRHPRKEEACRFDSEEHYLAQAFERFWQAITNHHQLALPQLSTALRYLHASLHGVLLDTLRTHTRPGGMPAREPNNPGALQLEDDMDARQCWEHIQGLFSDVGEQRWPTCSFIVT